MAVLLRILPHPFPMNISLITALQFTSSASRGRVPRQIPREVPISVVSKSPITRVVCPLSVVPKLSFETPLTWNTLLPVVESAGIPAHHLQIQSQFRLTTPLYQEPKSPNESAPLSSSVDLGVFVPIPTRPPLSYTIESPI